MLQSTNKAAAYLGAWQRLEWYGQAHLSAGRDAFYDAHYRNDILVRHRVTEADAAVARAYALAARRAKKDARGRGPDRRQLYENMGPRHTL